MIVDFIPANTDATVDHTHPDLHDETHTHSQLHNESHTVGSHSDHAKGADIASASSITPGTDGNYYDITGTTAITSIGTRDPGDTIILQFDGNLVLTHSTGVINLRGLVNLDTVKGTVIGLISEGSGEWREIFRSETSGGLLQGFESAALIIADNTTTNASAKQEVAGQSLAAGALTIIDNTTTAVAIDST